MKCKRKMQHVGKIKGRWAVEKAWREAMVERARRDALYWFRLTRAEKGNQKSHGDPLWVNPLNYMISSQGWIDGHHAVDLIAWNSENPTIVASSYGMVYTSTACTLDPCIDLKKYGFGANGGYGNMVIVGYDYAFLPDDIQEMIPYRSTLFVLYGHLATPSPLQEGEGIEPGQFIGRMGTTGASTGTHLHLEMAVQASGVPLPVNDFHTDTGYTSTAFVWSNLMTRLNPDDFFSGIILLP